jgi:hypothetical protein
MYEKNILLAKAAGKFLAKYLHKQTKTDEQILISLTKIAFLKKEVNIDKSELLKYFLVDAPVFFFDNEHFSACRAASVFY